MKNFAKEDINTDVVIKSLSTDSAVDNWVMRCHERFQFKSFLKLALLFKFLKVLSSDMDQAKKVV
jgi:hypothetical protein